MSDRTLEGKPSLEGPISLGVLDIFFLPILCLLRIVLLIQFKFNSNSIEIQLIFKQMYMHGWSSLVWSADFKSVGV